MTKNDAGSADRERKVALITGASTGLGFAIARRFADAGFDLAMIGRDAQRLQAAAESLPGDMLVRTFTCDVTRDDEVSRLFAEVTREFARLDVLVNNVGLSDRGLIKSLSVERMDELVRANVVSALLCSQAALPLLETHHGQIINIGSLAAKAAPRYLGGYAVAKHALAALTQQLRLELKPVGVNVILISPGPIQRDDAGQRYRDRITDDMPAEANRPAGGTTVKGLAADTVAAQIYRAYRRRSIDVILPGYLRLVIGIGHLLPSVGDRLLLWFTRKKE